MAEATTSPGVASPESGGGDFRHESGGDQSPRSFREQDRFLPIANISRIMKKGLPANGKIAKDAKETVQECVSEFISFITSEASDKCQRERRKTINGDDLLWAMATLGFEDYIDPLKVYLARYREMEGDTKGSAKGAEGSNRREGHQPIHQGQLVHQGSFSQGAMYPNSQTSGLSPVRGETVAKLKVAINGFGRIGRNFLRCWHGRKDSPLEVIVVNDSGGVKNASHLLKYDSMLGTFKADVQIVDSETISVDGKNIKVVSNRDPLQLPWAEMGIDIVIEDSEEQKQQTSSSQEDSNPNLMNFESCNCGDASTNLFFYINEEHLDHRLTLYQAILQHHIKAAQENITSASFWSQAYKLTYRRAVNCRQGCSQLQHQQAPCSVEKKLTYPQYSPLLSDMFVSDLASDVEKSSPTYDIILLLKVLESMNRFRFHFISHERACSFAEGRINKLDDLKVPVTCVPQNEFVNRRLTQKLEQQICDPYSLSIGGMPAWCSQLMSSCPFLFGFEVRSRYFRLAALGQRLNQPHLLSDSNSGGSNIGQLNTTSLPRKKFLVRRDQILESATKMMNLHASQVVVLEAEFEDEIGTGLGPTLEFYTLVSYEFQKLGLGMWREDHIPFPASKSLQVEHSIELTTPCGLFPRPWSSSELSDGVEFTEVINKYTLLGQVVAKALQDGRILDFPFSKAFYKLILEKDLTMYDIQLFDPTLCTTLLEFQAIVERNKYMGYLGGNKLSCITESCFRGTSIEDLCLDFSLPGYPDFVTSECTKKMVNIINLEEYVSLIVDATIGSGISRQMEAFKLGFNQVFPIRHLQIFTEEELEHFLCGDEVWNINELLDHIKFDHGYTSSCPPVVNLLSIMREFDREQQKAFLRFVTGAARLPHGGLASLNPKLTVVRKHCSGFSDNDLPSAMTCAHYLKLPPYSSKEKMKEKLLYAITEGQGCFNLS